MVDGFFSLCYTPALKLQYLFLVSRYKNVELDNSDENHSTHTQIYSETNGSKNAEMIRGKLKRLSLSKYHYYTCLQYVLTKIVTVTNI